MSSVQKTKEIKETIYICDICGKQIDKHLAFHCYICGKDLCHNCRICSDSSNEDPIFGNDGDYPTSFCYSCWKVGENCRAKAKFIVDKCDNEIEELKQLWIKKAGHSGKKI